jgi:O-antigen ligase
MRFGYGMLVSVVFLYEIISSYKKTILKKKWIFLSYILFAISLIEMIIYGARGALVSFVLLFAIDRFIIHRKFIFFNIISVGLFFLIYSNILNILTWFQKIINIFGGRAYAIDKIRLQIAQGIAEASSGRDDVYMRSIDCIKENFLFGRGIDLLSDGEYAHNIFLQVFQDLGFFAFLVLIIFLFSILIYFFKNDANEEKNILAIFFSISIGRLLFSSILWRRPEFWMLTCFYFSLINSCKNEFFLVVKK